MTPRCTDPQEARQDKSGVHHMARCSGMMNPEDSRLPMVPTETAGLHPPKAHHLVLVHLLEDLASVEAAAGERHPMLTSCEGQSLQAAIE